MRQAQTQFPFLLSLINARNPICPTSNEEYPKQEQYFLNLFEIGLFELYEFLFHYCKDEKHLENWIIELKGEKFYHQKVEQFNNWLLNDTVIAEEEIISVLTKEQIEFWEEYGYLHLTEIIPTEDCESVVDLICEELMVDLEDPNSWYPTQEKLQGLMLQLYQGHAIEKNRKNSDIFKLFAQLYNTIKLLANTEKVSYNPPETDCFKFKGSTLHWDIDFNAGVRYHIQGLVYLNDVPANRGAFSLVPGYHHKIKDVLKTSDPVAAINSIKETEEITYLAGKKGDLILWLEAIPHAATANNSNLPRFVQYLSFSKI